jgi:WD40 repeat protein
VAFDSRGEILATAHNDGDICLWDVKTKQCLHILEHFSPISIAFCPINNILISCNEYDPRDDPPSSKICFWDSANGKCLLAIKDLPEYVQSLSVISNEGKLFLATGGNNGVVRYWHIKIQGEFITAMLIWSSIQDTLVATDACFEQIDGLSKLNAQLLEQRGARYNSL